MRVVNRRTVLAGAVAAVAPLVTGCGRERGRSPLEVAVVWSGTELSRFHRIMSQYGANVSVISAGNNMEAFLNTRRRTRGLPDVAILPQIRIIRQYAADGLLEPMRAETARRFPGAWNTPLTIDSAVYGAWVKAAHKSLFWYRPGTVSAPAPRTWKELREVTAQLAAKKGPAPLSIGAADGWVLTDWLENLLAGLATGAEYQALATPEANWLREPVPLALRMLAELWRTPGAFPSGPAQALLTQYDKSVLDVFANRRATMVFEGDFVASLARDVSDGPGTRVKAFRFPAVGRNTADAVKPLLVSGDAAVVFTAEVTGNDPERGHDLVSWLTRPEDHPFLPWIADRGFLSPNLGIKPAAYQDSQFRQLATDLMEETPRFDLSDQLAGELGNRDGVGISRVLRRFFAEATTPGSRLDSLVDRTASALQAAARRKP